MTAPNRAARMWLRLEGVVDALVEVSFLRDTCLHPSANLQRWCAGNSGGASGCASSCPCCSRYCFCGGGRGVGGGGGVGGVSGLEGVPAEVVEAARGIGLAPRQRLW